jgi:hypothetical protein
MPSEEASCQAIVIFGGIERMREICRNELGARLFGDLRQDIRFGCDTGPSADFRISIHLRASWDFT